MKRTIILLVLSAAALAQDKPAETKPTVISDTQKAAAWKAQALYLAAESSLKDTPQYKEYERRQQDLARATAGLCGANEQVQWTAEDIQCVPKPEPPKEEKP